MSNMPSGLDAELRSLAQCAAQLRSQPHAPGHRLSAGYAALHTARLASALHFSNRHPGVADVAHALQTHEGDTYKYSRLTIGEIVRDVLSDASAQYLSPLRDLGAALRTGAGPWEIGNASIRACVALLGLREFGGVFGVWQFNTLAYDDLSNSEHIDFNNKVLKFAGQLQARSADEAASMHRLPSLGYLKAGCLGNIAKANMRQIALDPQAEAAREHVLLARRALEQAASYGDIVNTQLQVVTKRAMLAACEEAVMHQPSLFWQALNHENAKHVADRVRRVEACAQLVALVDKAAESRRL